MRAYTVKAAAVALKASPKWVDNVLSHHKVPGVTRKRQGVTRRVSSEAMLVLEIALRIMRSFGVPIGRALQVAGSVVEMRADAAGVEVASGFSLMVDIAAIEAELAERLAHAVEVSPSPRRGRPPR